jgi:hypothetical protein
MNERPRLNRAENLPGRRVAAGCTIVLIPFVSAAAAALLSPGPWWVRVLAGLAACAAVSLLAIPLLANTVGPALDVTATAADTRTPATAPPGPDDPIYYLDPTDRRGRTCQITVVHPAHRHYWRTDQPTGATVSRPGWVVTGGSSDCPGVNPPGNPLGNPLEGSR